MNDDSAQLIFCVETTAKSQSDQFYIDALLHHYYELEPHKISYVYMGGKHNYRHTHTLRAIHQLKQAFAVTGGQNNHVLYVLDKDHNTTDYRDATFEKTVRRYIHQRDEHLIWFVRTIEDVMHGHILSKKEKKAAALTFLRKNQIHQVKPTHLKASQNVNAPHKSNILTVINQLGLLKPKSIS